MSSFPFGQLAAVSLAGALSDKASQSPVFLPSAAVLAAGVRDPEAALSMEVRDEVALAVKPGRCRILGTSMHGFLAQLPAQASGKRRRPTVGLTIEVEAEAVVPDSLNPR